LGIETVGLVSVGTELVGVETDGTVTVGVETDGTDTLGSVRARLEWGGMPTRRTVSAAMSNASAALAASRAQRFSRFWGPTRWPFQPPRMAEQTYPTLLISMHAHVYAIGNARLWPRRTGLGAHHRDANWQQPPVAGN
jgi:hypothetical protein